MAKCETAGEIDAAAAAWTARIDRGPLQPGEERDFQSWLDADPRRLGAFARAQAVLVRAGGLPFQNVDLTGEPPPSIAPAKSRLSRQWRSPTSLQRIGTLAAVLAVVVVGLVLGLQSPQTSTRRGEIRLVPMPDGSAIMLNTASKISTSFTDTQRNVELLEGEALFNVAKDAARPFIVKAAATQVRAVGTSFSVRRMPDGTVQVLVREGVVEVTRESGASEEPVAPVRAAANIKVIAPPRELPKIAELANSEVARELVWREGVISFDGVSLQQAADEFARYSDMHITFASEAIARRKVTGLFAANDPVGFSRAVALSMNLSVDVEAEQVSLRD